MVMEKWIGFVVEIVYLSKTGKLSKRVIRINTLESDYIKGYCFISKGNRTFKKSNILAAVPVTQHVS